MLLRRERRGKTSTSIAAATSDSNGDVRIARWLQPREIVLDVRASTREQVLHAASEVMERFGGLIPERIYDALWRRERAGSTALGRGFAIPHARIPGIGAPVTAYLRTATPIDCAAADGIAVTHFLVILVPTEGDTDEHLQLLALVANLFSDRLFVKRLDRAESAAIAEHAFTTGIERVVNV